jgi:hypothetical protein
LRVVTDMSGDSKKDKQRAGLWQQRQGPRGWRPKAESGRRPEECAVGDVAVSHALELGKVATRRQTDKTKKRNG